jgi:hypothetical protein
MKPIKILLEIKNHTVHCVYANVDIQYIIVNRDDLNRGWHPLSVPLEPEIVQDPLYLCYSDVDPQEAEIRENLRRIDF